MSGDNHKDESITPKILSPELEEFYASHSVNVESILEKPTSSSNHTSLSPKFRFIRLNPRFDAIQTLSLLKEELEGTSSLLPQPIPWFHNDFGFYAIPASFPLSQSGCFRTGRIYGMDISSGTAVAVLMTNMYDDLLHNNENDKNNKEDESCTDSSTRFMSRRNKNEKLRVLDLCCAPGLKLCMLADMLMLDKNKEENISANPPPTTNPLVIGVDIAEHRINICKKIIKKYQLTSLPNDAPFKGGCIEANIQLYCHDGVTFGTLHNTDPAIESETRPRHSPNLVFDLQTAREDQVVGMGKRKRMNKSARARERKRLKLISDEQTLSYDGGHVASHGVSGQTVTHAPTSNMIKNTMEPFDFVLVDAECSTDGSLKHMQQQLQHQHQHAKGKNDDDACCTIENHQLTNETQLKELVKLQMGLIASGFRLLKPGGTLVYSTCSLSTAQNENVVRWLLDENKNDAALVPLVFPKQPFIVDGGIRGTARFVPSATDTFCGGGFFVAKIRKLNCATSS